MDSLSLALLGFVPLPSVPVDFNLTLRYQKQLILQTIIRTYMCIFGSLVCANYNKLHIWSKISNENISHGDFPLLFNCFQATTEAFENIQIMFKATWIWPMDENSIIKFRNKNLAPLGLERLKNLILQTPIPTPY